MTDKQKEERQTKPSVDMSPAAIAARIEKVSQLRELTQTLRQARPSSDQAGF